MTAEKIAKIVCEKTYLKMCNLCALGAKLGYSVEEFWEKNKEYFTRQAEAELAVKECLEAK